MKHLKLYEDFNQYKEVEFVCVNSDSKTATNKTNQINLYNDLKKLQKESDYGILPYRQDFSDDKHEEISLAVVITDKKNEKNLLDKIMNLSKQNNVEFDLINIRNDKDVDGLVRGDLYDNIIQ